MLCKYSVPEEPKHSEEQRGADPVLPGSRKRHGRAAGFAAEVVGSWVRGAALKHIIVSLLQERWGSFSLRC